MVEEIYAHEFCFPVFMLPSCMCLGKDQSVFGDGMVKTQAGFEQAHDAAAGS